MRRREYLEIAGLVTLTMLIGVIDAHGSDGESNMTLQPTPQQAAWQEAELAVFFHFGINTFTDREWGDGTEDPRLFNPRKFDANVWLRVARNAGFKYAILTAKHHDGFCLWPSKYTEHCVKNSPWRNGTGDVVKEFVEACRKAKVKPGLYLSPWDRNCPFYGDSPRYNEYFKNQLTELLTNYGEIAEVWFDGACGEGPNGKKQVYDWDGYYAIVRKLQPNALIAICGPDIRWVGNESGLAQETEWCIQNADPVYHKGIIGKVWWPAETDVSIRPGWFWHASEDEKVKSVEQLADIYFTSVGRNTVLLLNVPPNSEGLIAKPDIKQLYDWQEYLKKVFSTDFAQGKPVTADSLSRGSLAENAVDGISSTSWTPAPGAKNPTLEVDLGGLVEFNVAMVQERIAMGQYVAEYRIEACSDDAGWREIAKGTTIGQKKLDRFPSVKASKVRLVIAKSTACPHISRFGLFKTP